MIQAPLPPFLTDAEIREICAGLSRHSAMRRYLVSLGLAVKTKPNGMPLVGRAHFEAVMGGPVAQATVAASTTPATLIALHDRAERPNRRPRAI